MWKDNSTSSRCPQFRLVLGVVLAAGVALLAQAEEQVSDSESVIEEVLVIGIRGSLDRSLEIKQAAAGFVDAVSAEDVGKLPDHNIAEALQRVPGVTISRNRGEGDFVSIRGLGPNFVRGAVNNQTLVSATESRHATRSGARENSTGRETNFDVLPSEVISRLEVVKTPSAEHVEGGIGGIVNVYTHKPLELGDRVSGSVQATRRGFNKETDPAASALVSWANDDESVGLLASATYSERSIREDNNDSYGYWPFTLPIDADGDGSADLPSVVLPFSSNPAVYQEDRERTTLQGTLQWRPTASSDLAIHLLHSKRDIDNLGALAELGTCCVSFGFDGAVLGNGVRNADGSPQVPDMRVVQNTAVGYSLSSQVVSITDVQRIEDQLSSLGLAYSLDLGYDWNLNAEVAYAAAEGNLSFQRTSLQTYDKVPFMLSLADRQINLSRQPGGPDLSDLSSYFTRNGDAVVRVNEDDEQSVAVALARDFEGHSWLSALKVGIRYRARGKDKHDNTVFNVNTDQFAAAGIGDSNTFRVGNFLDGDTPLPFGEVLFADVEAQRAYIRSQNPDARFDSAFSPALSYETEEDTLAGYVQLDLEGELGGMRVMGDVGLRIVQTRQDIGAFFQPFRIDNDETTDNLGTIVTLDPRIDTSVISSKYTNVLPSANLRLELADDWFVRLAASKSLTRPTFTHLAPGLTSVNPTQRTAESGNPGLEAYESTNFDVGIEWYFADSSVVYASVFAKYMDNFIGTSTQVAPEGPGHDGDGDGIEDGLGNAIVRFGVGFASLSQPLNQGEAEITGFEFGYQHVFDNGFGYIVNATLIDSEAEFVAGVNEGETIPFEGVSDLSYNLTGFYESQRLQLRLSYSYRDEFVAPTLSSDVFGNTLYVNDYGQLDGQVTYTVNDNYRVFFNAVNLTGEDTAIFSDTTVRPVSLAHVGARYELGVRASF